MVSRNLERANESDGFKMTALEVAMLYRFSAPMSHALDGVWKET